MCLPKRIGKQVWRAVDRIAGTLLAFLVHITQVILSAGEFLFSYLHHSDIKVHILGIHHCPIFPSVFSPPANSSDSEDQSVVEGTAKPTASKNSAADVKAATSPKCHGRSPPSSHKYHKQGDADHAPHRDNHGRSPRVYKWSFQMCKCQTSNSLAMPECELIKFRNNCVDIICQYLSPKMHSVHSP